MNSYKLTIQYKGTNYLGWQVQEKQGKTIQGELNRALCEISKSQDIRSLGSGRTDAGVHALGQVCHIKIPLEIEANALHKGLNALLPDDIRVVECLSCSENFHPIKDARSKEYWYFFSEERVGVMQKDWLVSTRKKLDIKAMQKACDLFLGSHDFCNYFCVGTATQTTIREIYECELILEKESSRLWKEQIPNYWVFRVRGSGFLKQMVRLMVGTLWEVGKGRVSLEQLKTSLEKPLDKKLGPVAPPQGLTLYQVMY